MPAENAVWLDDAGLPYKVRFTTRQTVYYSHKGKEDCMNIAQWMEQMVPFEVAV